MPHNERTPALVGSGRGSGSVFVGDIDNPDNTANPTFMSIGEVSAGLLLRLANRHAMSVDRARVVAQVAGLRGMVE